MFDREEWSRSFSSKYETYFINTYLDYLSRLIDLKTESEYLYFWIYFSKSKKPTLYSHVIDFLDSFCSFNATTEHNVENLLKVTL